MDHTPRGHCARYRRRPELGGSDELNPLTPSQPGPAHLVEVAERVFAYLQPDGSRWVDNAGFIVARQTDLGEYAGWLDCERIVGNLHRAYHDLDQGRAEPDRVAALADMVAYNGGHPLSCYA